MKISYTKTPISHFYDWAISEDCPANNVHGKDNIFICDKGNIEKETNIHFSWDSYDKKLIIRWSGLGSTIDSFIDYLGSNSIDVISEIESRLVGLKLKEIKNKKGKK